MSAAAATAMAGSPSERRIDKHLNPEDVNKVSLIFFFSLAYWAAQA